MIYFRPWGLFYGTRNMCRLTNFYIRMVRREWVKAREQERKEIEALHRWEEAHIFEGGGRDKLLDNSFHRKSGSFCCIVLYMSTCAGHLLQKLVKKCKIANKRRNFSKSHLQSKIRIRLSCDLERNQIQVLKLFPCKEYDTGFKDLYDVHNLRQLVEQEREARSNKSQRRFSVAKCLLEAIIIGLSALCSPYFSLLCLLK